jgi:hypothetical protein
MQLGYKTSLLQARGRVGLLVAAAAVCLAACSTSTHSASPRLHRTIVTVVHDGPTSTRATTIPTTGPGTSPSKNPGPPSPPVTITRTAPSGTVQTIPPASAVTTTTLDQNAYIYPGDAGICAAINSIARIGLNPATCVVSPSLEQCAVTWETTRTDCPWSHAAYTGISGAYGATPSGTEAVSNFMATSTRALLTAPGIGPEGQYFFQVNVGVAWTPPNPTTGGGFVAVIGVCSDDPNSVILVCQ